MFVVLTLCYVGWVVAFLAGLALARTHWERVGEQEQQQTRETEPYDHEWDDALDDWRREWDVK